MRIVDALIEVLKENESLTYKEAYSEIVKRNLYEFGAKKPEVAVNAKLRCHCEELEFPGASPVKYFKIIGKKGTRFLYALKDSEEKSVSYEPKIVKVTEDNKLPEEIINQTYLFYKNSLKSQLLGRIIECHPSFFENLVVNLLLKMGYGVDNQSGKVIGKPHDGGIDGVIYEDRLGLSKIYIQAKRYDTGNTIGIQTLQSFVGAMQNIQKGVFVTTSSFTKEARKYAENQQQKCLKLIDGDLLANFMIKYEIGLEKVGEYIIYKLNEDYFE